MKLTLRLVTVICYFLPFTFFLTTCNNGLELRVAYNQKEADKNMLLEKESIQVVVADSTITDSTTQIISSDTVKTPSDTLQKSTNDYRDKMLKKVIMPTSASLSGLGSILYFKNLTGQIVIAISLIISLILFVAFKFLKSQKTKLYLLLASVLCLTIFVIDSFISSVTLLWGCWTLLALLMLQLIIEFNDNKKAYR